jgi:uncharacterized protein (DUF2141 family)
MLVAPACGAPAPVAPAGVTVRVDDVASSNGQVMIALCDRASFMKRSCPIRGRVSAKRGSVAMRFNNVAPGDWAVQVFHDENGNGQLDRNGLGIPLEGVGFSRDAKGQYGPPTFDAAFVAVRGPIVIPVALAY